MVWAGRCGYMAERYSVNEINEGRVKHWPVAPLCLWCRVYDRVSVSRLQYVKKVICHEVYAE